MGFGKWIAETFAKSSTDIITSLADTADRFITTGEEKQEFKMKLMEADMNMKRLQMEAEQMYMSDRQSARAMYEKDSSLQKVFAIVFLVFYCLITAGMIAMVIAMAFFETSIDLPQWGVMLISSAFTAMSTKVATITDFLFGGSKKQDDSPDKIAASFQDSGK
jgi:hypothetical protein